MNPSVDCHTVRNNNKHTAKEEKKNSPHLAVARGTTAVILVPSSFHSRPSSSAHQAKITENQCIVANKTNKTRMNVYIYNYVTKKRCKVGNTQ